MNWTLKLESTDKLNFGESDLILKPSQLSPV